jgi:hypothetical protein
MKTREQMVKELTELELRFLLDNPDQLHQVTMFFAGGGYDQFSDKGLQQAWDLKVREAA